MGPGLEVEVPGLEMGSQLGGASGLELGIPGLKMGAPGLEVGGPGLEMGPQLGGP